MRRSLSIVVVAGVALALLSGCTPAMNEEAVAAAEEYSADLASWAVEVSDAATLLSDEQEEPLIEALDAMPTLTEVADAEGTASYVAAARAAEHAELVAAELRGYATAPAIEPFADQVDEESRLGERLDAADRKRFDTIGELITTPAEETVSERLAAHRVYAEEVIAALEEESELVSRIIPDDPEGLMNSLRAFVLDQLAQDAAFHEQAAADAESWSHYANGYKDFSEEDPNSSWTLYAVYFSPEIAIGYGEQLEEVAAVLSAAGDENAADADDLALPGVADPYRAALLADMSAPDSPSADREPMWRLWMLWRIRELEDTPDAVYDTAVAAISEELVVHVDTDVPTASLHAPGSQRLLDAVRSFGDVATDMELDEDWLARLTEVRAYEDSLRAAPVVTMIDEAFDGLLAAQDALLSEITELVGEKGEDAEGEVAALISTHFDEAEKIALPAMRMLDDPEEYEQMRVDAVRATAPSGADES